MKGAFKIAKFAGIPVFIHWTFAFFMIWVLYLGFDRNLDMAGMAIWIGFMLTLFFCVVLHEYGHALTARYYGINTQDIILSPIGGVARLDKLPENPIQEFMVAVAGPLVNIAIAGLIFIVLFFFGSYELNFGGNTNAFFSESANFWPLLLWVNIILAVFNLIPAFPMDGGRIFRSLLAIKLGREKATQIASYLGQAFAVLFMMAAFYMGDFIFGLIGVFVFLTAAQEYRMVKLESVLKKHKVSDLLRIQFRKFFKTDKIADVLEETARGVEKNFLVLDEMGEIAGVLDERKVMDAARKNDAESPVEAYFSNDFEFIRAEDSLKAALNLMQLKSYRILPVLGDGALVGVVDIDMMNDFLKNNSK